LAELVKIVDVTGRSTNHCPNSGFFHFFKHNQRPAFIITNRLPIARLLPCTDQLIGATTILTHWPLVLAFCHSGENIAGRLPLKVVKPAQQMRSERRETRGASGGGQGVEWE
jgi:hypothetical protein